MKLVLILSVLFVMCAARAQNGELPLAQPCDREACKLPSCRCAGTDIPGNIPAPRTPQFVMVTYDDAVNVNNIKTYRKTMYNRRNPNGCRAGSTYYVCHEYTDYQLVNELYNQGFEIALHSISHRTPQTYWQQASYEDMMREFGDQKIQMAHLANIPYDEIKGLRIPFLQMTGNASFQAMAQVGLQYDASWGTIRNINPGLWPYTLDYRSDQECLIPPCPTASIPGVWVNPMVAWLDLNGTSCLMVDSCYSVPALDDPEGWFKFIVENFERHYLGNRAPFGFYIHEWYLAANPAIEMALAEFLNMISGLNDVFLVNSNDVIEWVKDPVPVDEYVKKPCRSITQTTCDVNNCGPLTANHVPWELNYWMTICNACPSVYPWVGNPLGQ